MTTDAPTRIERVARLLWALFSLYLLYGTVIPFDIQLQKEAVALKVDAIEWVPFVDKEEGGLASRPDLLANTVLFVPFGLLGFWAMRHRGRRPLTAFLVVGGLGIALSLAIEVLQLFTRTRYTASTDLIVNTVGVVLGVGCGLLSVPAVERLRHSELLQRWLCSPSAFGALAAAVGVAALTWQPFLFSLDAGDLFPKLRDLVDDPFVLPETISREPLHFLMFFLFGLGTASLFREQRVRGAVAKAVFLCTAAAFALEPTRLAVHHQTPAVSELAAKVAGCAVGAVAMALSGPRRHALGWSVAMFAATVVVTACAGLSPFRFASNPGPFGWIPLFPYYEQATVDAATDAVDTLLQVMPFGFVVGLLHPGRRLALVLAALGIALSSTGIEWSQRYLPGRLPDITDVLMSVLAVAGGYAAATRAAAWYRGLVAASAAR